MEESVVSLDGDDVGVSDSSPHVAHARTVLSPGNMDFDWKNLLRFPMAGGVRLAEP